MSKRSDDPYRVLPNGSTRHEGYWVTCAPSQYYVICRRSDVVEIGLPLLHLFVFSHLVVVLVEHVG